MSGAHSSSGCPYDEALFCCPASHFVASDKRTRSRRRASDLPTRNNAHPTDGCDISFEG